MVERFDLYLYTKTDTVRVAHYVKARHYVMLGQVVDFCENLPAPLSIYITAEEAALRSQDIFIANKPIGEVKIKPTIYEESQIKNRYDLILHSYDDKEYVKYAMTLSVLHKIKVRENRGYLNFDKVPKIILRNAIKKDVSYVKEVFEKAGANLTVVPTQYPDMQLAPIFSFFKA
jgi:hypothetical protein